MDVVIVDEEVEVSIVVEITPNGVSEGKSRVAETRVQRHIRESYWVSCDLGRLTDFMAALSPFCGREGQRDQHGGMNERE